VNKIFVSPDYIQGYSDCLTDIEAVLPKSMQATNMEMLNSFIVSLYLGKQFINELQKTLEMAQHSHDKCCDCSAFIYFDLNNFLD